MDVAPQVLLGPVGERIDLPDAALLVALAIGILRWLVSQKGPARKDISQAPKTPAPPIPRTVRFAEASASGSSVFAARKNKGASAYQELAQALLERKIAALDAYVTLAAPVAAPKKEVRPQP